MKLKLFSIVMLASMIGSAGLAQAATYTIDFAEATERQTASGTFVIDPITSIGSASMDFTIRGKTTMTNSRGYSWYYDPNIDLSIGGTQMLNDHHLGGDFTVLRFDLGAAALNAMIANLSLDFNITAQDGFWWSDLSPWGGISSTRFYLDSVSLNVTAPSAVPLPGAVWLFGTGLVGLIGFSKRKKAARQ